MKFACDKCGTKYNIDAARVATKPVKIKCRKCEHVITVTAASAIPENSIHPAPPIGIPEKGPGSAAAPSPKKKVLPAKPEPHPHKTTGHVVKPAHQPISGMAEAIKHEMEQRHSAVLPDGSHPEVATTEATQPQNKSINFEDEPCWFVAMAGKPIGPISARVVFRHQQIHEVGDATLVWREGMAEWVPLHDCRGLSALLDRFQMRTVSLIPGSPVQAPHLQMPDLPTFSSALSSLVETSVKDTPLPSSGKVDNLDEFSFDHHHRGESMTTFLPPPGHAVAISHGVLIAGIAVLVGVGVLLMILIIGRGEPQTVVKERIVEKTRIEYRDRPISGSVEVDGKSSDQSGRSKGSARSSKSAKELSEPQEETREERKQRLLAEMSSGTGAGAGGLVGGSEAVDGSATGAGLGPQQMSAVVSRNQGQLQVCYEQSMKRGEASTIQDLKVNFDAVIGGSGMVRSVRLSGPGAGYPGLQACLSSAVKKWMFPAADGESRLQFPILFTPSR